MRHFIRLLFFSGIILAGASVVLLSAQINKNEPQPNSTMVESIDEHNWRLGKVFTLYYLEKPLRTPSGPEAGILNLVLSVGNKNIAIKSLRLEGVTSNVYWQFFMNSEFDDQTGTEFFEIPMNATVTSSSGVRLFLDPTITSQGVSPTSGMAESAGVADTYQRPRMNEDLITTKLALLKNTNHILKIQNIDGVAGRSLLVTITFVVM